MAKGGDIIRQKINGIKRVMKRAPGAVGSMAVHHFKQNFQRGGFVDDTLEKWKARKDKKNTRALLVKRGRLKNSLRVFRSNEKEIVLGSSIPYARIHNEGGSISQAGRSELIVRNRYKKGRFKKGSTAGRGFSFGQRNIHIPRRQFIGDSKALRRKMDNWYIANLKAEKVI